MPDALLLVPLSCVFLAFWSLVAIDLVEHRLPNRITLPLLGITFTSVVGHSLITKEYSSLIAPISAILITFAVGLAMAKYLDFGMGDVKLLMSLNALLAWHSPNLIIIELGIAFASASVWGLVIWIKSKDPKARVAFGPFLLVGFISAVSMPTISLITAVVES